MADPTKVGPVLRPYSEAMDLTEDDLKTVKERLETVGLEPSRLLATWMEESMGLEYVLPAAEESPVEGGDAEKRMQMKRSDVIKDIVERVRTELGPISGVDPISASGPGIGQS